MLHRHSSGTSFSNQDQTTQVFSRRPGADSDRLALLCRAMVGTGGVMKPTESRVFCYLLLRCVAEPITFGESDKIVTIPNNASAIGRDLGIGREHVSRALHALISRAEVGSRNGRIWPRAATIAAMAERTPIRHPRPDVRVVAFDDPEPAVRIAGDAEGCAESARGVCENRTGGRADSARCRAEGCADSARSESAAPYEERAGARPRRRNSIQFNSGEENTNHTQYIYDPDPNMECLGAPGDPGNLGEPGKEAGVPASQDHIYTVADATSLLSPEEEAWVIAFCDRQFPTRCVPNGLLPMTSHRFPFAWHVKALKRAALLQKPRWRFIMTIMDTWEFRKSTDDGPEDAFDDTPDMRPMRRPTGPEIPTAAAEPRYPLTERQRQEQGWRKAEEWSKQGLDPLTGKPYEADDDES